MAESTHRAEVYEIKLEPHPNPESNFLSIVNLAQYTCVVTTEDWQGVTKAVHILPDSIVNVYRPEFQFLVPLASGKEEYRVRAIKLKGIRSFGFLIPVPNDTPVGEDWAEKLGVKHYEPEDALESGPNTGFEKGPSGFIKTKYDVEAGRKYASKLFCEDDEVVGTEKIHGENLSVMFAEDRMWVASRNGFKREFNPKPQLTLEELTQKTGSEEKAKEILAKINDKQEVRSKYWEPLINLPQIVEFCKAHPYHLLYGELVGTQKGFPYHTNGKTLFVAFDIRYQDKWLDYDDMASLLNKYNVPMCPVLYRGKYDFDKICDLAEGKTVLGNGKHVREGIVVRTVKEKQYEKYGRASLKWVGVGYSEKS